jgi:hypothetical protein
LLKNHHNSTATNNLKQYHVLKYEMNSMIWLEKIKDDYKRKSTDQAIIGTCLVKRHAKYPCGGLENKSSSRTDAICTPGELHQEYSTD